MYLTYMAPNTPNSQGIQGRKFLKNALERKICRFPWEAASNAHLLAGEMVGEGSNSIIQPGRRECQI